MFGSYLGPNFSDDEIIGLLNRHDKNFIKYEDYSELCRIVAGEIANGKVVGWFRGRMEFGPRALGNRSILGDARNPDMQRRINQKIKFREGFRPFAPSILDKHKEDYFELEIDSPYMLMVTDIHSNKRKENIEDAINGLENLHIIRSEIPAVTHVDFSARIQTVHENTNADYYKLIHTFYDLTGCPVVVNTSFNVRGEPIVCNPEDAFKCFMKTDMDILILENFLINK